MRYTVGSIKDLRPTMKQVWIGCKGVDGLIDMKDILRNQYNPTLKCLLMARITQWWEYRDCITYAIDMDPDQFCEYLLLLS